MYLQEKVSSGQDNSIQAESAQKMEIIGINVEQYEFNQFGIPLCLDILIGWLSLNEKYMCLEGIFRKNASMSEEQKIIKLLSSQQYHLIKDQEPYALSGVVKKICDKMPNPVIPYDTYSQIVLKMRGIPTPLYLRNHERAGAAPVPS